MGPAVIGVAVLLSNPAADSVSPASRALARFWMVFAVLGPLSFWAIPAWVRTSSLSTVARAVDARLPQLQGSLETAVGLAESLSLPGNSWSADTRALANKQLHESASQSLAVCAAELLPIRTLSRTVLLGPLFLAAVLIILQGHPQPLGEQLWSLFGPVEGPPASATASETERAADLSLRNITIRLEPPAYSKRESIVLDGTSGDFRALPGTRIELKADMSSSGTSVELQWLGESLAQAQTQGAKVALTFTSPGGGWYRLQLNRGGGRKPRQSRKFRVEALPDGPPRLELQAPANLEVNPRDQLELGLRVSDDFALSRLDRVLMRGSQEVFRGSWADVEGLPEWNGELVWSPSDDLGDHGGKLELVVEAFDNDTVNGPKVTRSRPLRIYVPTERDQHTQVLQLKQLLLEHGIDLLAPMLLATRSGDSQQRDGILTDFDAQRSIAMSFFNLAGELAIAASKDRFEKKSVFLGLGQLVENFARRFRSYEEFIEAELRHHKNAYIYDSTREGLARLRGAAITELEQLLIDLSAFIDLQRGETVYDKALKTEDTLASLSELLRDGEAGKPVREELSKALAQLAEELRELGKALAERSRGPDDSFQNQLPQNLGKDLLRKLGELVEEGRYSEALDQLRQAMEAAASLRAALEEEQQMAGGQQGQQLQKQLAEAIAKARELEKRQKSLIDATRKLEQRFGDGESMDERQRQELAADIETLLERISQLPPEGLPPRTTGAIRQRARLAHSMAEDLREAWLRQGDLERAIERGEVAEAYLQTMEDELNHLAEEHRSDREHTRSQIRASSALAGDIVSRLRQGMKRSTKQRESAGGASEKSRLSQDRLRGDVGRLRAKLEDRSGLGGGAYNPISGRESLEAAGQLMGGASKGLSQGRLGQALQAERGALDQLKSFREALEASQQAMQATGGMGPGMMARRGGPEGQGDPWQRMEGMNGDANKGKVDLPDPADFVSPEAFRSLVQEGASGDAPGRYRPLNSSYYEELLR
jgi:hypothetical protein